MKGIPPALRKALSNQDRRLPKALAEVMQRDDKGHKYGAERTTCLYRHVHDSKKEAMWCVKLHQLQKEGKLRNLVCEPIYDLRVNGIVVCTHQPDFDYDKLTKEGWIAEVMDVKGIKLPLWKLKHKLFLAVYPAINYVVV
jgi:hypothetical protein